ncbi:MAG: hypothetical protein OQK04_03925, partial [Kangiellaceae bacterium]|nr:hypothetical protein [Kangiellaceae bacterium]
PEQPSPSKSDSVVLIFGILFLIFAVVDFGLNYFDIYTLLDISWTPYASASVGVALLVFSKLKN